MRPYSYLMSTSGSEDGHYVELLEIRFRELLSYLLVQIEVDEDWYLSAHHDVQKAVRTGAMNSGRAHYIRDGYFENRFPRPIQVDEDWYLAEYPDVGEAIKAGVVSSVTRGGFILWLRAQGWFEKRGLAQVLHPRLPLPWPPL